jgi:hypothetical protein
VGSSFAVFTRPGVSARASALPSREPGRWVVVLGSAKWPPEALALPVVTDRGGRARVEALADPRAPELGESGPERQGDEFRAHLGSLQRRPQVWVILDGRPPLAPRLTRQPDATWMASLVPPRLERGDHTWTVVALDAHGDLVASSGVYAFPPAPGAP